MLSPFKKHAFTEIDDVKDARREKASLIVGLVALGLLAALFCYKYFTGYTKVALVGTFDNCTVDTYVSYGTGRGSRAYYYVTVTCPEPEIKFHKMVNKSFYNGFKNYTAGHVTFYKTADGHIYPTYKLNCDEREAEREYRAVSPPTDWLIAYAILGLIAAVDIYFGTRSRDNTDFVLFGKKDDEY